MRRTLLAMLAAWAIAASLASPVRAFEEYSGTVPLGMGGAARAFALGDSGLLYNPSGMTLAKSYTLEAGYGFASRLSDQFFHASVVDDTSALNLAGGLYYTYHLADRSTGDAYGHEGGLALAYPFSSYVALGATLKYFRFEDADDVGGHEGGLTFDVGLTVRPTPLVSVGLVGANLRSLDNGQAPESIGYGLALLPSTNLLFELDGMTRLTADNQTGRKGTSILGGGAFTVGGWLGLRAGGGYDAATGNGYATLGLSGISQIGAIDAGLREDLTRAEVSPGVDGPREMVVGVSLRLFVPAGQTQPEPGAPLEGEPPSQP